MSWFQEVKPYFLVARLYGLAPYSFLNGLPSNSKPLRIFSSMMLIVRMFELVARACQRVLFNKYNRVLHILLISRAVVTATVFMTEGIVCLGCLNDLKISMNHIDQYDRALGINFANKKLAIRTWLILAVAPLYLGTLWSVYSGNAVLEKLSNLYFSIRGVGWFAMGLKFIGILSSLERRFHHLSNILTKGEAYVVDENSGKYRRISLQDVARLHGNLVSAAKKFNSMHNMALLLWIFESSFFMTLEVYNFFTNSTLNNTQKFVDATVHVMPDLVFLIYLFSTCHNTAAAANKIGWIALSPYSCVVRGRFVVERDERFLIGQSFILNPLQFIAGYGLLRVDLPLLGTIFGAMTTVLVIICGW